MGKLTSGRVKRTPQNKITPDRYQFLGLNQAEPNLGDPLIGPSSITANPIPVGSYFQLAAIGEKPGERYWTTPVGLGTTIGIISVYDNGFLPSNAFSRIHGLNFVGSGVTVETPPVEFIGNIGIATIRIASKDILNSGEIGQVLFNTPSGIVGGALSFHYEYSNNNVGIGSTIPTEKLDVYGITKTQDLKIQKTLIVQGSPGLDGQVLKSTGSGLVWDYLPLTTRVGFTTVAQENQAEFIVNYNPNILDVFVNGVRLNKNEFTATDGTSITLTNTCFGGEIVDVISYDALSVNEYNGSGGLSSRTTVSGSTGSISDNQSANISIIGFKTYLISKIETSHAAWVTVYTDQTSRTNDASRLETTPSLPGSGVIAEVITTGATSQLITPGTIGFNNDSPVSSNIYLKVVNKSGSSNNITVTLTLLQMEQ